MDATFRIILSRLIMLVALACGVIGLWNLQDRRRDWEARLPADDESGDSH